MEPQTIVDQPVPLLDGSSSLASGSNTNPVVTDSGATLPTTHVDQAFPPVVVARETLSQSLNTETKTILATYTFEQLGAIAIGIFKQGVSGEIDISPNGILSKNINGDTTFAIDGATGNALFSGTVTAAGFNVIDSSGLISTLNFAASTTSHGVTQTFTTTSYVDLINSSQTFTLPRSALMLITVTLHMFLTESVGNKGDANVTIDIDGVVNNQGLAIIRSGNNFAHTYTLCYPVMLAAGNHTLKLKAKFDGISAGSPVLNVLEHYMTRIQFGN